MSAIRRSPAALLVAALGFAVFGGLVTLVVPAWAARLDAGAPSVSGDAHGASAPAAPTEMGQGAFAAIAEIVSILDADPNTDWAHVDIAALRDHLVDMNRVMVDATVVQRPIPGGVEMTVQGPAEVVDAARRMVRAHAAMVGASRGWQVNVDDQGRALVVSWTTPRPEDVTKLRALGFYGFMVDGSHHQQHHLMIARGMNPHGAGMR